MLLRLLKNMLKKLKKGLGFVPLIPASSFATNNPFDVMGVGDALSGDTDILAWFKDIMKNEYMPLVLGIAGFLILIAAALHIHHYFKEAKQNGGSISLTELIGPGVSVLVGMVMISLGFTILSSW